MLTAFPAAAVSKPAVPSFSVQCIDRSYDVPTTYTTSKDPYTGVETQIPHYGYHVKNITIEVTIHHQDFTPYRDEDNKTVNLFYNVRAKGHYEDWYGTSSHAINGIQAALSGNTVVSFDAQNWGVQPGGEIDFQVEAVTGYQASDYLYCGATNFHTTDVSGWSNTQTIKYANTVTPTPTPYTNWPTATPYYQPDPTPLPTADPTNAPIFPEPLTGITLGDLNGEQTTLIIMAVVVVVSVIAVIILLRRTARK
jgi:hypothetical protein